MSDKIIDMSSKRRKRSQSLEDANQEVQRRTGRPPTHGAYRSDVVYAERIVMMRELLGFSQEDFAEILKITHAEMQAWEDGTAQPTLAQLELLSYLSGGFPIGWFCQPVNEGWPGLDQTSLRFH